MARFSKYLLRHLPAFKTVPKGDDRSGFDFVWVILMLTGFGLMLNIALRMIF